MSNNAELNVSVDTSGLKDAKVSLDALVPAADKVEKKTKKVRDNFGGLNSAADKLSAAAAGLSAAADKLSNAFTGQAASMAEVIAKQGVVTKGNLEAAKSANQAAAAASGQAAANKKNAASLDDLRAKYNPLYAVTRQYLENKKEIRAANIAGAISEDEMTAAIKRQRTAALAAIGTIKAGPRAYTETAKSSNLAAHEVLNLSRQFADIGVTAAMGMNPLMILIQQGPQIADIFASAASRGVKFNQAMKALLVQLGLVRVTTAQVTAATAANTVSNTAATASALGLVSANEAVAASATAAAAAETIALTPLALIIGAIALAAAAMGSGFALAARDMNKHNKDIVASLGLTEKQMEHLKEKGVNTTITMGDSFLGFFKTIGDGLANIFAPQLKWISDTWDGILDFITKTTAFAIKVILGSFMFLFGAVPLLFKKLPAIIGDAIITGVNIVKKGIQDAVNFGIDAINRLGGKLERISLIPLANPFQGAMGGSVAEFGNLATTSFNAAGVAVDKFAKTWEQNSAKIAAARIKAAAGDAGKIAKSGAGEKEKKDPFAELMKNADAEIAALKAETDQVGLYGRALAYAAAQAKMLAEAKSKGVDVTDPKVVGAINDKASQIAEAQVALDRKRFMEQQAQSYAKTTREIAMQRAEIGMSADEIITYEYEQRILNDALDQHIELTEADRVAIKGQAEEMARGEIEVRKMKEALEFAKTTAKGFFSDMRSGLQSGKTLWQSLADSVIKALDRIISKLEDQALDALFSGSGATGSGGKSMANSIAGAFDWILNADGNAFNSRGVTAFAKGAGFTNSVLDKPTMFAYGGSNLGVMGEAGPEAVMPLQRGPDGSLGVKMYNGSSGSKHQTNNVEVNNHYTLSGAMTSDDVITLTRQAAEQTKQSVKENLVGWLDQSQRDGTVV